MMKKWLFTLTISAMVLGGCSDSTVQEVEEVVDTPEVEAAEAPEESSDKADVLAELDKTIAYSEGMGVDLDSLTQLLEMFGEQNQKVGVNPEIMFDEDWQMDTVIILQLLDETIASIRESQPPEAFQQSHDLTMQAMDEFQFMVDNYPAAVDNLDVALMEQCVTAMTNGANFISQATEAMPQ